MSEPRAALVAADALEGARVVGVDGVELGAIEEVLLDLERGSVAYAVISCPSPAQRGARLLAIPWAALKPGRGHDGFVLEADRARLEQAPSFTRDQWPPMADAEWARRLHDFYGVTPYWKVALRYP